MHDRSETAAAAPCERKVGMGELVVLQGAGVLRTLLGSCIGLVLYDAPRRVAGLAHIVLPTASNAEGPPGKYADTALPELIRQIELAGGRAKQLTAKYAGGANMFASTNSNIIGDQNVAAVAAHLQEARIPVLGCHCGGTQGRRLACDVETGKVTVEIVGSPPLEI